MTAVFRVVASPTTNLSDNIITADQTNYLQCSAFSRWIFTTNARRIWIKAYSNLYAAYPTFTHLAILVNGATLTTWELSADGSKTFAADLPAGTKTVEIVNSLQSKPAATVLGVWPVAVYLSGGGTVTQVTPTTPANRLLAYGDSIAVGGNCTYPITQGVWGLVRVSVPVIVEAWGYRSLYDDGVDATARQTFVDHLALSSPGVVWIAIGTNDYGIPRQTAANFGTAYADLLDKLHTALPSATIYAQTPLVRSSEGANALGDTLGAYRTQIATAQSTRSAYCNLVDGSAILEVGDLADGVHPTTVGHAKYAAAVKTVLGLS
jgi:lysophospholipase L1-like esterase